MLRLLIVRHAVAEEREQFARNGGDDSLRPLTREGKIKMEQIARGLRKAAGKVDVVATSPFLRAAQTARVVAAACGGEVQIIDSLIPTARPSTFLTWLREYGPPDGTIAVVGHEPHLGQLTTWLMAGTDEPRIAFKKGGACLLEFERKPQRGKGVLLWALTPSLARRLS
jgi:phosphohistidine phosphatase